jgi:cyclic AMP-dependent transcription factor ATF-4
MSVGKKRKPYERKTGMRRTKQPVIDKKERKKIQNGEAARRYRDKKKNEQQLLDEELDELVEKNISLKSQVNEKEKEFNDKTCFH